MTISRSLPEMIRDEAELEEQLSCPSAELVQFIRSVKSPLLVLGAGGKMGPSLAVMARRAAAEAGHSLRVVAVSRFSDPQARKRLEACDVETISADLLDRKAVAELPPAGDVVYLVGLKFGTAAAPELTWAVNTLVPGYVMERYSASRVVALSTGNVYPLVPVKGAGAREDHPLTPIGEYANSAVARERIFSYFSRQQGTPLALIRLNYSVELRYGVLSEVAMKVARQEPIDVSNCAFNCIWQRDANDMILRSLSLTSSRGSAWNLTSPETLLVKNIGLRFGEVLGKAPVFVGAESETALLSDASRICAALGNPPTPLPHVLHWTAHWIKNRGRVLNKLTHFEVRDGQY